jgi:N-acetylneuraminic acid mutarotase
VLAACDGAPTRDLTGPESEAATLDVAALAASNTWATKTSIPASHLFAKAGAINGIIYVVGGENSSSQSISTVRAYQQLGNQGPASVEASVRGRRRAGRKLYVAGGANFDVLGAPPIGTVRVYDPGTNAWATKASMLTPRYYAAGINAGGGSDLGYFGLGGEREEYEGRGVYAVKLFPRSLRYV